MSDATSVDDLSAEVVRIVSSPGYSHAGNVFLRLQQLEQTLPTDTAIRQLHREVLADLATNHS